MPTVPSRWTKSWPSRTNWTARSPRSPRRASLRRLREPPEAPARQAFLRLGPVILELVETGHAAPAFWGLVVTVADLDAAAAGLGELLGSPRDAVQPGRRIATVRQAAGLSVALALMSA